MHRGFTHFFIILGAFFLVVMIGGGAFYLSRAPFRVGPQSPPGLITPSESPENKKHTCPTNGWENCMPVLGSAGREQCSKEALDWKTANCPNFKGAAY